MQELARDDVGEGWEGHRLLLSIKEGGRPIPGAECCVDARLSSLIIVLERRLVPRDTSGVWFLMHSMVVGVPTAAILAFPAIVRRG